MENTQIKELYSLFLLNPQFSNFVEENKNKSIEDIAMEYDIKILKEQNV